LFASIRATDQAEVFLHYAGLILRHDNRRSLADIRTPTLVIAGGQDQITTVAHGQQLAQGIPLSMFRVLPEAGHYIPLLHTEWLVEQWLHLLQGRLAGESCERTTAPLFAAAGGNL